MYIHGVVSPLIYDHKSPSGSPTGGVLCVERRLLCGILPAVDSFAYSVGGMHCMLIKWIELGMTVPSEQLVGQLRAGFMSAEI